GGNDGTITVHATGGSAPYQFRYSSDGGTTWSAWMNPGTPTFSGLATGTYMIQVKDNVATITTLSPDVTVSQPAVLSATVASTDVTCNGGADGTITVSSPAGGHGNYEYSINGGTSWHSSGLFTGLIAGGYNVMIRDA